MVNIDPTIFKAYDIRGLYPQQINEDNFSVIINSIGCFFQEKLKKKQLKVVLGRDMRLSSPSLFKIAKDNLINLGIEILDVGLVSTPTFYFAVLSLAADAGIQISASHNPPDWNGVKFVVRDGRKIIKIARSTGMDIVKEYALKQSYQLSTGKGKVRKIENILDKEVDFAFDFVKPKEIKPFKVVADPANAMGILYLTELFRRLPCSLIKMNFTLDGRFPAHEPNPLIFKNLKSLQEKVVEEKAQLGIAPDGDGDRVFFIDEKGEVIHASLISALISRHLLRQFPGEKIGVDVRYIKNIKNAVEKAGGRVIIGSVGHSLITEMMIKNDILFTGESSGHFFYKTSGYAESSLITILLILDILSEINQPISQVVSQVKTAAESEEINFTLPEKVSAKMIMDALVKDFAEKKPSWLDGLSIDFDDWRFCLRASNTEPLIRLTVEGDTQKLVEEKTQQLINRLISLNAKIKQ